MPNPVSKGIGTAMKTDYSSNVYCWSRHQRADRKKTEQRLCKANKESLNMNLCSKIKTNPLYYLSLTSGTAQDMDM